MAFVTHGEINHLGSANYAGLHMANQKEWVNQNVNDMEKIKRWYSK